MKREVPPISGSCDTPLTVKYVVIECHTYENERQEAGIFNSMWGALNDLTS